ncbi:unnamed protein product [Agarophyton chilense]|eukprot:gb/GEZJ01001913.1/.p1 GENE.gb/GEZJ01001913.1/~~gb/GEZJ01001913.1/.p1  ORF type:complete len:757 (-),score=59.34 gb/GEZJ01001913.1/:1664-3934(-)
MGGVLCKEELFSFQTHIEERKSRTLCRVPWHSEVEVDCNGCRKFRSLPPPGQHPRLFFSAEDLPSILTRFTHTEIGDVLRTILHNVKTAFLNDFYAKFEELSTEEVEHPSKTTIEKFFTPDEIRNVGLLGTYVSGFLDDDEDLMSKAKRSALFYARVILESKNLADINRYENPFHVWKSNRWDLHIGWMFGGSSYALLYDLMFNELNDSERQVMRRAITTAVKGRRSWGMGFPGRRIQSNWAGYHGDLLSLCAVVEGEEGFDREVYNLFSELMVNFLSYAVYESGHTVEDFYTLNLGMREGSMSFLVMARRGHNVFNHPHYKKIWSNWMPFALEPHSSGKVYGGSSGNFYDYPTSAIIAKYMFPKDPYVDYGYKHYMHLNGTHLGKLKKLQSRLVVLAFALPPLPLDSYGSDQRALTLPLDFVCRPRGKVVMRSDWTDKALWFTLDARPDCFLIGHDVCSRGAFVLNADGRAWGFCPEWHKFRDSDDYSLPHIDGVGQKHKAPFVKLLDFFSSGDKYSFASADLTYAYNWTWTTWASETADLTGRGFEHEPNDPADFGFNLWWAPRKLYGEGNVGFQGLHQWRQRFATVEKVYRSALMIRSSRPYIIIVDDVQKDGGEHAYSWAMTTPDDVHLLSFDGVQAILAETHSCLRRRLLIRSLSDRIENLECSFREVPKLPESAPRDQKARQIVFKTTSRGTRFIFLLCSMSTSDSAPLTTKWLDTESLLSVSDGESGEVQTIQFSTGSIGQTVMKPVEG